MNVNNKAFLSSTDFTRLVFGQIIKYRYAIILSAIALAILLGIYAYKSPVTYTSKAIIFSLNSTNDNPGASSALSMLLGAEAGKSFNDESSINIIELASSRAIGEAVAAIQVPSMQNKNIATLLIDDMNNHRGLLQKEIKKPASNDELITLAAMLLKDQVSATINKNNSFILNYTGKSEALTKIISYAFIDKISQFYIDIKREKAKRDFEFASSKADSLRRVMNAKDYKLIAIDKRTLFTNTDKLQYRLPEENLAEDKQMVRNQYAQAVINQQTAAYKLQKDTPLIKVLDKPEPPYDKDKKSVVLYCIIGLIAGSFFAGFFFISGIFFRFAKQEIKRAFLGSFSSESTSTTASAL